MRGKIRGHRGTAAPVLRLQHFKGSAEPLRIVSGVHQIFDAETVCVVFVQTAVVQHGRRARSHASHHGRAARASAAGKTGRHARHHAEKRGQGNHPSPLHASGNVALRDVGYFVGKHPGKFGFVPQVHDEPRKHEHKAAGSGKGVQRIVQHDIGRKLVRLRRQRFDYAVNNALHVVMHHRVFNDGHGRFDQHLEFPAHLHFILKREVSKKRRIRPHRRKQHADHANCGHHGT